MAKTDTSKEVVKIDPMANMPAHLREQEIVGIEDLSQFIRPPFLKIIQKQSGDELQEQYSQGTVLVTPAMAIVREMPLDAKGLPQLDEFEPFHFIPIFFYPEWLKCSPIEKKGQLPFILERTTDPNSPLVALSRNKETRIQHDPKYDCEVRHVEAQNWLVVLHNHPIGMDPMIMSFQRGEHGNGGKFASMVRMRKSSPFNCIFEASVGRRSNPQGSWFGYDIDNPRDISGWVDEATSAMLRDLHTTFAEAAAKGRIKVDYDPDTDTDPASTPENSEF